MATGPYYLATPLLTSYHQQFWVIAQIVTENKDGTLDFILIHFPDLIDIIFYLQLRRIDESFEKKFHVSIAMDGIIEDDQVIKMVSNDHTHNRYPHLIY